MASARLAVLALCLTLGTRTLANPTTSFLSVQVDDSKIVYVDGTQQTSLPNANIMYKADNVTLNGPHYNVIAIQATNTQGGQMGIIASTAGQQNSSFVTGTTGNWKCSDTLVTGWTGLTFDDSAWPVAVAAPSECGATVAPGIGSNAGWIWTKTQVQTVPGATVYCRGNVNYCTSSNCLSSGQTLYAGQQIWSQSGAYNLIYQTDGNLCIYFYVGTASGALWNSDTEWYGTPINATMQTNGNLVVTSVKGGWNSGTAGHPGAYLVVRNDGNLVMYVGPAVPSNIIWQTNTVQNTN